VINYYIWFQYYFHTQKFTFRNPNFNNAGYNGPNMTTHLLVRFPGHLGETGVVMLDDLLLLGQLYLLLVAQLQRVRVVEHGVDVLVGPGLHLVNTELSVRGNVEKVPVFPL
jgi:hypothetical protein